MLNVGTSYINLLNVVIKDNFMHSANIPHNFLLLMYCSGYLNPLHDRGIKGALQIQHLEELFGKII